MNEIVIYSTEDGATKIDLRLEDGTVWLSQLQIAELFQTSKHNVSIHTKNIFEDEELTKVATVKESLTVRKEGTREVQRAKGATYVSPGQRPGIRIKPQIQALKGRPNRCLNPSPVSTYTSYSARKIANLLFPTPFAPHCTLTWPQYFRTLVAPPCSSIRWRITSIYYSSCPAPYRSARSSRTSKSRPPNGSRPKGRNWEVSGGKQDTEHSPFPNRMSKPCANTSPVSGIITERRHFRKNTANFSNETVLPTMRDMSGTDLRDHHHWVALSGLKWMGAINPRALPWASINRPVGTGRENRPMSKPTISKILTPNP